MAKQGIACIAHAFLGISLQNMKFKEDKQEDRPPVRRNSVQLGATPIYESTASTKTSAHRRTSIVSTQSSDSGNDTMFEEASVDGFLGAPRLFEVHRESCPRGRAFTKYAVTHTP